MTMVPMFVMLFVGLLVLQGISSNVEHMPRALCSAAPMISVIRIVLSEVNFSRKCLARIFGHVAFRGWDCKTACDLWRGSRTKLSFCRLDA